MKKYTKHLWLVAFLFLFLQAPAQVKQYKPKKERTAKAQAIEKEVQAFIEKNIDKYELSPEKLAQLKEGEPGVKYVWHNTSNLTDLIQIIKRQELRKLYFKNNPSVAVKKTALEDEPEPEAFFICDNGGFENGTNGYTFTNIHNGNKLSYFCDMPSFGFSPINPAFNVNSTTEEISLVDNDLNIANGNDQALEAHGIHIPRVFTGNSAIKLNNDLLVNSGWRSLSTMRKQFVIDSKYITYSFSLIVENPTQHDSDEQPHFIARLYRANGRIMTENCIIANSANTTLFNNAGGLFHYNYNIEEPDPLLYTRWQCDFLSTEGFDIGELATIEFIITDCGLNAHYGTVYIDDICGADIQPNGCPYGDVNLKIAPNLVNCAPFPVEVCGTFIPPHTINTTPVEYGVLSNIKLRIFQGNLTVNTVTIPGANVTDNEFCFYLTAADFGGTPSGEYKYEAIAEFEISGSAYTVEDMSPFDADAIFNNCIPSPPCPDCITITTDINTGVDNQQAYTCINASNTISGAGTEAVYRAGKEIVLLDGFDALSGTVDRFHIEGCNTNSYVARTAAPPKPKTKPKEINIDLVERTANSNSSISIYPNPTNGELNVVSDGASVKTLTLFSLDGKVILKQQAADANSYKLNVNAVSAGIYLLTVEAADGSVTSHKIIKN